ncbi:MAG TPA: bifunctional class I SAM-dependent methyltransferase/glycosyltransferase family 2 protein [Alphaproteobacteria bacterium]
MADAAMTESGAGRALTPRKRAIIELADRVAPERRRWIARNRYFYDDHYHYMRFLVGENARVLDLGCGTGELLAALAPRRGVGVDISPRMIEIAQQQFPDYRFVLGDIEDTHVLDELDGPFDVIVLSEAIGSLEDIETTLRALHRLCTRDTRLIVAYYSRAWQPVLTLAEMLGSKQRQLPLNWLSTDDIASLLGLADFEMIKREWRQLLPKRLLGLGPLVNRSLGTLPGLRRFSLRSYVIARPRAGLWPWPSAPSATVLIPCRNERGNIEPAIRRMPRFAPEQEILFVEGHSADGTFEEIERAAAAHPEWTIRALRQPGRGKGDAVRTGFAAARGEVLMILDADLTVEPEALPKFYDALVAGKGEFINGTRLVYPTERQAMRPLNLIANRAFSLLFSWLLNQRLTDTLCGTKVLRRAHYDRIAANRGYFGDFDPFGDFDLIFGAAKLNLKLVEIPIRYQARAYGETQISRFADGWLLLKMVLFAWRKLKAL